LPERSQKQHSRYIVESDVTPKNTVFLSIHFLGVRYKFVLVLLNW
jgi:hypothetical protein